MMSIFSDMIEKIMEVFMDDFTVYGKTFDQCLENLDRVLQRCEEKHLILNWEKCHFMVQEGIVLGHCGGINPYTLMGRYGPHHQRWLGSQDEDVRRMTLVGVHRKATRYCTK